MSADDPLAHFDDAPCALVQTADDGTFLRVNRTFCTWVGRDAADLVGQRRLQDLLTVGGRIFHQTHLSPLLRMQGSISEVKLDVVHRDGTPIPMVFNSVRHERGGVMVSDTAAFIARDRDRYERELVLSRRRLEDLHAEAKDRARFAEQMIGIVGHDLRNPLATILMGSAVLARGGLDGSQQRVVGQITRATDRANRLIADLLDFTQARVGTGLAVSPAPTDLHDAVAEALEELRLAHPSRGIVHTRTGAGACVADTNRLVQLVGNLVGNALAYGRPDVDITVATAIDAATCSVAVHNAGPAIPDEQRASLFEPMTRGTKAGSKSRSVGLGLFIVREIARAHGGEVEVRSSTEDGTTFRVTFPATRG